MLKSHVACDLAQESVNDLTSSWFCKFPFHRHQESQGVSNLFTLSVSHVLAHILLSPLNDFLNPGDSFTLLLIERYRIELGLELGEDFLDHLTGVCEL